MEQSGNFTSLDKIGHETRREENVNKAKQIALGYNLLGFTVPFIAVYLRTNYVVAIIGILYPLLGILILYRKYPLIIFWGDDAKNSRPSIGYGFMVSVVSLLMRSLLDYHILSFYHIVLPVICSAVMLFISLYKSGISSSVPKMRIQITAMAIMSIAYGLGFSALANCVFDYSNPVKYKSSVVDAYATNGRGGPTFHFIIAAWPGQSSDRDERVDEQQFLSVPVGSAVEIYQKKGLLNAPWYYIKYR
jgi:uncharacterized membrane protein